MSRTTDLEIRMKTYENVSKNKLMRRCPVAIRLDGCHFKSFTKGFDKPFDIIFMKSMQETMKYLCENVQGCVLGYTQSDEITLILVDYEHLDSEAWFDDEVEKICSVTAGMASMVFNKIFYENTHEFVSENGYPHVHMLKNEKLINAYRRAWRQGAYFDARCFNIPKEEVTNLIYWRQCCGHRNAIQAAGCTYFSNKELLNKSGDEIIKMLKEKGIEWSAYSNDAVWGSCCVRNNRPVIMPDGRRTYYMYDKNKRTKAWIIDYHIPVFTGAGRLYINALMYTESED